MADSPATGAFAPDERDVTRAVVGDRIGEATAGRGRGDTPMRPPTPQTYEPAEIARRGVDDAFLRAGAAGRHRASPQRHDAVHLDDRDSTSDASDDRAEEPYDDPHADDVASGRTARIHPWIRATLRWSLAIAVTVGLTYLLVTRLLDAVGGLLS